MYRREIDVAFRNRKASLIGSYRKNAVMILAYEEEGKEYIIYEQRAFSLKKQPGDICFPGGKIEDGETPMEAALRETSEELGVLEKDIEIIGEMDYFISPYGTIMYPFVGRLHGQILKPNKSEVEKVIMVPMKFLLDNRPKVYEIEIVPQLTEDFPYDLIYGGREYKFSKGRMSQYFYSYGGYNIWGFTALITKRFIDIIIDSSKEE